MNDPVARSILLVSLVKVVVLLFLVLTAVAYLVWFERKVAAHIQGRWGPYRVGPHGLLQPLADGVKFLLKEDATPAGVDRFLYFAAPLLTMTLAISTIAMIPFGPASIHILGVATPLVIANINVGLLAIFAITSIGVYGVALAGWSSNSKYSLLGGLRSSAQMISYELSLTLSVVGIYASMITVACLASILFLGGWLSPFPQTPGLDWTRYLPAGVLAVAGVALIINGLGYGNFFGRIVLPVLGLILFALSFLCSRPSVIDGIQGPFWFLAKVLLVLFVYVWVRWTLPRFRYDQLMRFGWKVLFPVALLNVVLTSLAVALRK
ncbi:MAG: NADH-quinone oxidoreductase subunit H [Acidobacteria bacterium]|nr:MAG: NADH-quinone oxidoreductase subunit H [Acidobacteriota bacterium]